MTSFLWHVALTDNVDAIMRDGLVGREGHDAVRRWDALPVADDAVYVHADETSARERLSSRWEMVMDGETKRLTMIEFSQTLLRIDEDALDADLLAIDHEELAHLLLRGVPTGARLAVRARRSLKALRANAQVTDLVHRTRLDRAGADHQTMERLFSALGLAVGQLPVAQGVQADLVAHAQANDLAIMYRGRIAPELIEVVATTAAPAVAA